MKKSENFDQSRTSSVRKLEQLRIKLEILASECHGFKAEKVIRLINAMATQADLN